MFSLNFVRLLQNKFFVATTTAMFITAIKTGAASAAIFSGSFVDPLLQSFYPNSLFRGNFSFNSASISSQGLVSFDDILFSDLETSGIVVGFHGDFNGTGWFFSPTSPFVFNTNTNLFQGVYELERDCSIGRGCPLNGVTGQLISNPNTVFWDPAPGQRVTIAQSGHEEPTSPSQSIPEPGMILGLFVAAAGAAGWKGHKTKPIEA